MTSQKIVHVIGTGTIGEPLVGLLTALATEFAIDEISFSKRTPISKDRAMVNSLIERGAKLAVAADDTAKFEALGHKVSYTTEEALARATVVVDCTPAGCEHKESYADISGPSVFIAQGSETGFGQPYVRGVNDSSLDLSDRFVQVVSCNTHNICTAIDTFARRDDGALGLDAGRFVCMRRASDLSQPTDFIAAPEVSVHSDARFGTHHAHDAWRVFQTLEEDVPVFSSSVKLPTQYMHISHFSLDLEEPTSRERLVKAAQENRRIAITEKLNVGQVFSFGRDHGHFGRILNVMVLPVETLHVSADGLRVTGMSFTPQDGNSLLSSISCILWYLHGEDPAETFAAVRRWSFQEV